MRNGIAFWIICISLVMTRLVGMHLHACAGLEVGVKHASAHYADNGFFFGDHHAEDDGDDREVDFLAAVSSTVQLEFPDFSAPLPVAPEVAPPAVQLLTVVAPRGPPRVLAAHPPHFAPPLRGPPISLA